MPIFTRPRAWVLPQKPGETGIWEKIEQAGRTCYKSFDKITYDENGNSLTAREFANKILNVHKHLSVAEHATIYFTVPMRTYEQEKMIHRYQDNPFSVVTSREDTYYITTNLRVLIENGWMESDWPWIGENRPTPDHIQRFTVRLFTDRGVSAESNRHRCLSPSERSTRFVNYESQDGRIPIVIPDDIPDEELGTALQEWNAEVDDSRLFQDMCGAISEGQGKNFSALEVWLMANSACEWAYLRLIDLGYRPQQARRILPLDVQTELVITADEKQWARYFQMRYQGTAGTPHPDMKEAAGCIIDAFEDQGWMSWVRRWM